MGDPFRNELQAAHAKMAQQDEKIALLEAEKAALARGAPVPWNTGTILAITAPVVVAVLMVLGGAFWMFMKTAAPPPPVSVEPVVPIMPAAVPAPTVPPPAPVPVPVPVPLEALKAAAAQTLAAVQLGACYTDATKVTSFHEQITFSSTGHVAVVEVDQPGALTDQEQRCVARTVREQAVIEPFSGRPVRVGKTFTASPPGKNDPGY